MLQYVTTKLESQTIEENGIPLLKEDDNKKSEVRFFLYCDDLVYHHILLFIVDVLIAISQTMYLNLFFISLRERRTRKLESNV